MIDCIQEQARLDAIAPGPPARKHKALELQLESIDAGMLDAFCAFVRSAGTAMGALCPPPHAPPTATQRWTVLASPHVHKTARTQFERRTHTRQLQVCNLEPGLARRLLWYVRLHSPPDVSVDARLHRYTALL